MPSPQEVRPGAKVPRSGIYQENLSQRRTTLVKGEPAPPTPHKASRWQRGAGLLRRRRVRPMPGQRFQPAPARRHAAACAETLRTATLEARRLQC